MILTLSHEGVTCTIDMQAIGRSSVTAKQLAKAQSGNKAEAKIIVKLQTAIPLLVGTVLGNWHEEEVHVAIMEGPL